MNPATKRTVPIRFRLFIFVIVSFVCMALWFGLKAAWADSATLDARWIVTAWRAGKGPARTPELWLRVREEYFSAARITPDSPLLHDDLGYLHASQATILAPHNADAFIAQYQNSLLEQALGNYRTSTALRPTFPYSWVYLARVKHQQGNHDAEFWRAFDNAYRFGQSEAGVQPTLARLAFSQWAAIGTERQQQITQMVLKAQPAAGKTLREIAAAHSVKL